MKRLLFILASASMLACGCNKLSHISFSESEAEIANPERGLYTMYNFLSADAEPLSAEAVQAERVANTTLLYTGYYLSNYMNSDIDESFLQLIRKNMQTLRDNGAKCILRFAYTQNASEENQANWDAKPEIVQRHIQNITPILRNMVMSFYAGRQVSWESGVSGIIPITSCSHQALLKSIIFAKE
jgi:hypothetical protein